MPKPIDFRGPYLKAERAEQHIHELGRIFWAYVRANEKALRPNRYRQMRERGAAIGAHFPKHTPTVLGDALHNLRAALDHAYCALVEANGGSVNKHVKFPFTETGTRQDLEGSVQGHAKAGYGPSLSVIRAIFDEVQPFPAGNGAALLKLHVLDVADKHMILLPTEQHTHIEDIRFTNGGSIRGITFVTSGAPAIDFGPGAGLERSHNNQASFEICFGRNQPFAGEPILPVLK